MWVLYINSMIIESISGASSYESHIWQGRSISGSSSYESTLTNHIFKLNAFSKWTNSQQSTGKEQSQKKKFNLSNIM